MSDWLESAENKKDQKDSRSVFRKRLEEKKFLVGKNYEENGQKYEEFIADLKTLVKRANGLPEKEREPYGKINTKTRENRLNNHYYLFGSSRREEKREFNRGFKRLFKKSHFKYIRVIYFTVSSHKGLADIEIKERAMRRQKISSDDDKKHSGSSHKVSRIFRYDIEKMDQELAREVLDWLAFKIERDKMSFHSKEYSLK